MSDDSCLYPFCGKTKGRTLYIRVEFEGNDGRKRTWKKVGGMCDMHLARVVAQLKMEEIVTRSDNKGGNDIKLPATGGGGSE